MYKISVALTAVLFSSSAFANSVSTNDRFSISCEHSAWIGDVSIRGARLLATIARQCKIDFNASASITSLNKNLIDRIPIDNAVHKGPISETYRDLPSQYFEVTNSSKEDGDAAVMENRIHIATDLSTQLIYSSNSTKVTGSGNAQYLKVLNDEQDVSVDPGHAFIYKETQYVELEKPWYAPSTIFISQAKSTIQADFERDSKNNASTIAKLLLDALSEE